MSVPMLELPADGGGGYGGGGGYSGGGGYGGGGITTPTTVNTPPPAGTPVPGGVPVSGTKPPEKEPPLSIKDVVEANLGMEELPADDNIIQRTTSDSGSPMMIILIIAVIGAIGFFIWKRSKNHDG